MATHTADRPHPRAEILAIDPYVPGKSRVAGVAKVHKLSSNESASRRVAEGGRGCARVGGRLELYPDGASTALREAIGRRYGLDPRGSSAAMAPMSCLPSWRMCFFTLATKAFTANTVF